MDGYGNESKKNKKKGKTWPKYSNNKKSQIIYDYHMLESFLLSSGGNSKNQNSKKQEKHNPDTLKNHLYVWRCSKGSLCNFCQESMVREISKVCMERMLCLVMLYVTREILKMIQINLQIWLRIMRQQTFLTARHIFIRDKVR